MDAYTINPDCAWTFSSLIALHRQRKTKSEPDTLSIIHARVQMTIRMLEYTLQRLQAAVDQNKPVRSCWPGFDLHPAFMVLIHFSQFLFSHDSQLAGYVFSILKKLPNLAAGSFCDPIKQALAFSDWNFPYFF